MSKLLSILLSVVVLIQILVLLYPINHDKLYKGTPRLSSEASPKVLDLSGRGILTLMKGTLEESLQPEQYPLVRKINLKNNLIEFIEPDTFSAFPSVQEINLRFNRITSFTEMAILNKTRQSPSNTSNSGPIFILLEGNPLVCDCKMKWLLNWQRPEVRQTLVAKDLDRLTCEIVHPRRTGEIVRVKDLTPSDFLCKTVTSESDSKCPVACTCYEDENYRVIVVDCGNAPGRVFPVKFPPSVKVLYLDSTFTPKINANSFQNLKNLQELYLNSSGLSILSDYSFQNLHKLRILNLQNNYLKVITAKQFSGLTALIFLDLSFNLIEAAEPNTFGDSLELKYLDLTHNKLTHSLTLVTMNSDPCNCENTAELISILLHGEHKDMAELLGCVVQEGEEKSVRNAAAYAIDCIKDPAIRTQFRLALAEKVKAKEEKDKEGYKTEEMGASFVALVYFLAAVFGNLANIPKLPSSLDRVDFMSTKRWRRGFSRASRMYGGGRRGELTRE